MAGLAADVTLELTLREESATKQVPFSAETLR